MGRLWRGAAAQSSLLDAALNGQCGIMHDTVVLILTHIELILGLDSAHNGVSLTLNLEADVLRNVSCIPFVRYDILMQVMPLPPLDVRHKVLYFCRLQSQAGIVPAHLRSSTTPNEPALNFQQVYIPTPVEHSSLGNLSSDMLLEMVSAADHLGIPDLR